MKSLLGTLSAILIGLVAYTALAEQDSLLSSNNQQVQAQLSDRTASAAVNQMPTIQTHSTGNADRSHSGDELPDLNEGSSGDSGLNIQ